MSVATAPWLALVVVASTRVAAADPTLTLHRFCPAGHDPVVLPVAGQMEVAANTLLWLYGVPPGTYRIDGSEARVELPETRDWWGGVYKIARLHPGDLPPDRTIVLRRDGETRPVLQLRASGGVDNTPPAVPVVTNVIANSGYLEDLQFDAVVAPDTILLEVNFEPTTEGPSLLDPRRPSMHRSCGYPSLRAGSEVCFVTRAIDVAGLYGPPVRTCTVVRNRLSPQDLDAQTRAEERRRRRIGLWAGAAIVFGLASMFGYNTRRRRALVRGLPSSQALPALAVAQVARWRRRTYAGIVAALGGVIALVALDATYDRNALVLRFLIIIAAVILGTIGRLTITARLLDRGAEARRVGVSDVLIVKDGAVVADLVATDAKVARAASVELPRAELVRDDDDPGREDRT